MDYLYGSLDSVVVDTASNSVFISAINNIEIAGLTIKEIEELRNN